MSATKEDVAYATSGVADGLFPGAFCRIVPDVTGGDDSWCSLVHSDGTGTKASLAYVYWRETADLSVWRSLARDAVAMNINDMSCAGCRRPVLLTTVINRNRRLIPSEVLRALVDGVEDTAASLTALGCRVTTAGGETADVGDLVRTLGVDVSAFARMPRSEVVDNSNIRRGDVVVALASFGECAYEEGYNSGIGSNGLTWARHELLSQRTASLYPESFDPAIPSHLAMRGLCNRDEELRLMRLLLSPTRIYAPMLRRVWERLPQGVHGMVHCTGGGQTKSARSLPKGLAVVKDNLFPLPEVFEVIGASSGGHWRDMYSVFNMGQLMELYVSPDDAPTVIAAAEEFGIEARVAGRVEEQSAVGGSVKLITPYGEFIY